MDAENLKPKIFQVNNVRLARVSLATPFIGQDAKINPRTGKPDGKYHADLIFDEVHPQLEEVKGGMRDAIVRKFGDQAPVVLEQIRANNKLALHRGNVDRAGKPEYAGKLYVSASNSDQPNIVVTENGEVIGSVEKPLLVTPAHSQYPYSGCYGNVAISFFAYDYMENGRSVSKGVSCTLLAVQFAGHGERLRGASVVSASEFKPLAAKDADASAPATAAATQGGAGLI